MTTVPAAGHATRIVAHRSFLVALAIGRVEARKLLRHPTIVVGAVLSLAITVVATWKDVPVLNRYDALTNEGSIPLALGVLIATHMATIRPRRHRTTELFDSLAASDATVTAAQLIATVYASSFALVLVVAQLAYMKAVGGVTTPRWAVVLIGPALVAFAGAFGVALGRWAPRMFAAPLGIAGLVAICTALTTNTYAHNREWLSLWVGSEVLSGSASEVTLRPYGWRLLYLSGLVVAAAAVAIGRHHRLRVVAISVAVVVAAGTAYAGHREMQPAPRGEEAVIAARFLEGYENPSCREYSSVRYCPFKGYEAWVERWRKPVEGVLVAVPAEARPKDLRLLQTPADREMYDDRMNLVLSRRLSRARKTGALSSERDIHPSLRWGRNSAEGEGELAIALPVAVRATGIDTRFRLQEEDIEGLRESGLRVGRRWKFQCAVFEQGRAIVALWLAAQATHGAEATFSAKAEEYPYRAAPSDDPEHYFSYEQWGFDDYLYKYTGGTSVIWGSRETAFAAQLLAHDEPAVRAALAANWDVLTDPATTSDDAAALLGLAPLPALADAIENWEYFRRYRGLGQLGYVPCR